MLRKLSAKTFVSALLVTLGLLAIPRSAAADALGPDVASRALRQQVKGLFATAYNKALAKTTKGLVPEGTLTPQDIVIGKQVASKGYSTSNGKTFHRSQNYMVGIKPKTIATPAGDTVRIQALPTSRLTMVQVKLVVNKDGTLRPYKRGAVDRQWLMLPRVTITPSNNGIPLPTPTQRREMRSL